MDIIACDVLLLCECWSLLLILKSFPSVFIVFIRAQKTKKSYCLKCRANNIFTYYYCCCNKSHRGTWPADWLRQRAEWMWFDLREDKTLSSLSDPPVGATMILDHTVLTWWLTVMLLSMTACMHGHNRLCCLIHTLYASHTHTHTGPVH